MKPICFRPENWLLEELDKFQEARGIKSRTTALHKYIRTLKTSLAVAEADLRTLKDYKVQKDQEAARSQKRQCLYWKNETVTLEHCDNCREKKLIPLCPIAGKVVNR